MATRRIGVVGGVGPAATILYYRLLIDGAMARSDGRELPEVVIDSLNLHEIEGYLGRQDLDSLEGRLVRSVTGLGDAGCDSVVIACNAMHLAYDRVAARVTVPMVNLIDAVLDATVRGGYRTVGLLASTFVVKSGMYRDPLEARGIQCLSPGEAEQDWVMKVILGDLQKPVVPATTVMRLLQDVDDLKGRGAEAIILGCTDLPVAITPANSPLPVLDTAQIHVDAVLDRVLETSGRPGDHKEN
ncbi:MAG TPA: amino acid racemase [Gemmatimonadales bacterium]|nr:amino acid racemase [Gemmatimonadales bacterium]